MVPFHNVVLCPYVGCGAILRVSERAAARAVEIEVDDLGSYFTCPVCARPTRLPDDSPLAIQRRSSDPSERGRAWDGIDLDGTAADARAGHEQRCQPPRRGRFA